MKAFEQLREAFDMQAPNLWTHPYPAYKPGPGKKKGIGAVDYQQQFVGMGGFNNGHTAEGFGSPYGPNRGLQLHPSGRKESRKLTPGNQPNPQRRSQKESRWGTYCSLRAQGAIPLQESKLIELARIVATDRYQTLGMERPKKETVCKGQCEGTGVVPVYHSSGHKRRRGENYAYPKKKETDSALLKAWAKAEEESPTDDGWHFVKCPTCGGSGKRR